MIFYNHSESETMHTYTLRGRRRLLSFLIILLISAIMPAFFRTALLLIVSQVIFWVAIIVLIIDTFKMGWRQYTAGWRGKTMHFYGNLLRGNWRMEIEK